MQQRILGISPRPIRWIAFTALSMLGLIAACQSYEFVIQPDSERRITHLHFPVQTPSKADILFVIDNSGSMLSKQTSLSNSFNQLLTVLAPQNTSYRIGIVSTDAHGFATDWNGVANPPVLSNTMSPPVMGSHGNKDRPDVVLARPHDGTLGRLVAAYDGTVWDANSFVSLLPACAQGNMQAASDPNCPNPYAAVLAWFPSVDANGVTWPAGLNQETSTRTIIDHDMIEHEACSSCGCDTCGSTISTTTACYTQCIDPATQALVQAYFRSNLSGLGTDGFAWEEGLKSALWAVGINPEDQDDTTALSPAYNLLAPGAPNSYSYIDFDTSTSVTSGSWLRSDALLAVLLLTDEQDCSMDSSLMNIRSEYEAFPLPAGSICYQTQAQSAFLDTSRMAKLLTTAKGSTSRVAVGFIGGVEKTGLVGAEGRSGSPNDCVLSTAAAGASIPSADCSCFANADGSTNGDLGWCAFSLRTDGPPLPACSSFSGSRYVGFANNFQRRTFESICRNDVVDNTEVAFGPALQDFARIATLACFDLQIRPARSDPSNIVVKRLASGATGDPVLLPQVGANSGKVGWNYDSINNKICLTGLQRLIGDVYDIYILDTDNLDFTK